jgi:hypothetical protein
MLGPVWSDTKPKNWSGPTRDPPRLFCSRCGWTAWLTVTITGEGNSDAENDRLNREQLQVTCPKCNSLARPMAPPQRRPIVFDVVTAIRDAGYTRAQLVEMQEALSSVAPDSSPRDVAEQIPLTKPIVATSSRAGKVWIPWLIAVIAIVVTVYFGELAHRDAEQATIAADRAAHVQSTSGLTDKEIEQIAVAVRALGDQPHP